MNFFPYSHDNRGSEDVPVECFLIEHRVEEFDASAIILPGLEDADLNRRAFGVEEMG